MTQGAPFLPRSARPIAGDEGCHTLARFRPRASSTRPSSPSSPSSPCGALGAPSALDRASVAPRRFEPRRLLQARVSPLPQFRRRYAPELSQPVARPRPSLGFALQSFPFPGSRAAFRRPSASLRVRRRPCLRREDSLAVRSVSTTRLVLASIAAPREEDTRSRHWTRERDFPAIVKTACPPRELPRTATSTTATENLRARRHAAVSPASKPCSPRESVHATDREVPRACARRSPRPTGPVLSWVLPLQSFLRHDLGFGRLHEHPAAKPSYRESHSPVPDDRTVASILRPSPSETSGGFGWPPYYLHRRTLRASAPPLGGAPSSHVLGRSRAAARPHESVGLQRLQGRGSRPISCHRFLGGEDRPALMGFVLGTPPEREGVRATRGLRDRFDRALASPTAFGPSESGSTDPCGPVAFGLFASGATPRHQGAALPLCAVRALRRSD